MRKPSYLLSIATASVLLLSCEVDEKPAKNLPTFRYVSANGGVTFNLINGPENKVISTSILDNMYSVNGGTLTVNGPSGSMTIAVRNLYGLVCNTCTVENPEPLVVDTLNMQVHAGGVKLYNITVNNYLGMAAQNTGSYKFSGTAAFFNVSTVNAAGIEAFDLVTDSVYVNSTAAVPVKVNAKHVVNAFINSSGDVIYRGNPPIVRVTKTGSGKLRKE